MFVEKERNVTRYNTDDLNEILASVDEARIVYHITNYSGAGLIRLTSRERIIRVQRERIIRVPQLKVSPLFASGVTAYCTGETLKIRTPKALADDPDLALMTLGGLGQQVPVAPSIVVESIARAVMLQAFGGVCIYGDTRKEVSNLVRDLALELSKNHTLRVMDRIEAPEGARRKLTTEEALRRWKSDSFYGDGGVLEGPGWAWASGKRCPTGKWQYRIEGAQEYYERELAARTKYIARIKSLGGSVEPYETFPQYLRRLADEMEARRSFLEAT